MQTPRQLARAWRLDPAERGRIERLIAVCGMQHQFRWEEGRLLARIGPADLVRITASGGGAYRPAADRRLGRFAIEITAMAEMESGCSATLDGNPIAEAEAAVHRAVARKAA